MEVCGISRKTWDLMLIIKIISVKNIYSRHRSQLEHLTVLKYHSYVVLVAIAAGNAEDELT
jgi:hypothetical protein